MSSKRVMVRVDDDLTRRIEKYMRDVFVRDGITLTQASAIRALAIKALTEHEDKKGGRLV